jgi:hypothetical protein
MLSYQGEPMKQPYDQDGIDIPYMEQKNKAIDMWWVYLERIGSIFQRYTRRLLLSKIDF